MQRSLVTIDANEAVARVAYPLSEVIAIYPITPSTPMGEAADAYAAGGQPNLWGTVPSVMEMQAEGGAAGAIHGALQAGSLATTFTASQGLLLMIPNMYKIAGELSPAVFHVAARSLAAQALSIFGDHSDVMGARQTGWALLGSSSVQEAQDMALIAHAATLKARVPFIHFFDGFRTSHEINKIEQLTEADLRAVIDDEYVYAHRSRGLSPDHPVIRGTAQNPDVYFQARETVNPFYAACPAIVQEMMDRFAAQVGRQYHIFDYVGAPDAERVLVMMGSGAETAAETVKYLNEKGEKVGVVIVRLYRPFDSQAFLAALPPSVKKIAVLDRTKEPGSSGEPLYLDVVTALAEGGRAVKTIGGRYGLSSKEFTPAMARAVIDELAKDAPKNHFTVGIVDDISNSSLPYDPNFLIEPDDIVRCVFWGVGADGTVGANKNSIKIIGEETNNYAQGHFVYDSKKSGSVTVSHLRFGPRPIHAPYEVTSANFLACHQFSFLERYDVLKAAKPGGVFLLNSIYGPDEVWNHLPAEVQEQIQEKKLRFYVIDAYDVAKETGMGGRINTIMQTCFFAISGVLPRDEAIAEIKKAIKKTYGKRGDVVVQQNYVAVDQTLENLYEVDVAGAVASYGTNGHTPVTMRPSVPEQAPVFVREVLGQMIARSGDDIPVSALPIDGTYPVGTTQWEKRNITLEMPVWEPDICIQCNKCAYVCPHAVIRPKVVEPDELNDAPEGFKSTRARFREFPNTVFTLQISPDDCTGCSLCVEVCPAKDKRQAGRKAINMAPQPPIREQENRNWDFFLKLPEVDRSAMNLNTIKNSQLLTPLFEFSGACAGCGETPYIKLVSQLYGDRAVIANATGCSSIYGGNLPTTPYSANKDGRGPAWSNSLFEDNAEFGLGMRLSLDKRKEQARELLNQLRDLAGADLAEDILNAPEKNEADIAAQRERVAVLTQKLEAAVASGNPPQGATNLLSLAENLVRKSLWIIGGDGWAYDIGYGGLDHVLASGRNVNVLVLDTEVYSNTGGQSSKSTPTGAVAKFAAKGKSIPKKDLGLIAMAYGTIYVARVAMGYDDVQTLRAIQEAEAYDGPSLVIAYTHCIAHGINMRKGLEQQKLAVQCGAWTLYRYNPELTLQGENPLHIDSKPPTIPWEQYAYNETRFRMLQQSDPERAEMLRRQASTYDSERWKYYQQLVKATTPGVPEAEAVEATGD
jgi:pyruvate-ferredoxin/flavodoxin oxidoreductase